MNIIKVPGYPDIVINNVVFEFETGITFDFVCLSKIFGTNVLPIRISSDRSSHRKLTIESKKKTNQWYSITPDPLKPYEEELKKHDLFNGLFYEVTLEENLSKLRDSNTFSNEYKIKDWREPFLPPCVVVIFKGSKCIISGIRILDQGYTACHTFTHYLQEKCGIPASAQNIKILNIVCDTDLGYPVDLDQLKISRGNLASKTDTFPACIIKDENELHLVSLVYPNGKIVETGGNNIPGIIERHKKICDLCIQFISHQELSKNGKLQKSYQKSATSKTHTSPEQLDKINKVLKKVIRLTDMGYLLDADDNDMEEDQKIDNDNNNIDSHCITLKSQNDNNDVITTSSSTITNNITNEIDMKDVTTTSLVNIHKGNYIDEMIKIIFDDDNK